MSDRSPGSPEWDREVDRALEAALELDGRDRDRFLEELAESDPELTARVERLLAAGAEPDPRLDTGRWRANPPWESLGRDRSPEVEPGARIGPWRIERLLGIGGMAEVHLAERVDGLFEQRVAVKFVHTVHPAGLWRFDRERRILASLEHPRIARLLEGGTDHRGRPYLVMEYVEGERIDAYCERTGAGVEECLTLVLAVIDAVEYAHRNLVVHRDLKPANILVTHEGDVKLLDFGIARLLEGEGAEGAEGAEGITAPLARVLTPEYASPEQVRGERATTASDVFLLGILLYELMSGVRPFSLDRRTPTEVERVVCMQDPRPPSAAVRSAGRAADDPGWAARRAGRLRGDLDTIVMKALSKEPEARYRTVGELRDDLLRHREGLPVRARPPTLRYRARRFAWRHRMGVGAAALVLVALATGLGVASWQWLAADVERERAEVARVEAEQVADFLVEVFAVADPQLGGGDEVSARELLDRGVARIDAGTGDPRTAAALMEVMGRAYRNLGLWDDAEPLLVGALELRTAATPKDPGAGGSALAREGGGDAGEEGAVARSLAELGRLRVDQRRLDEAAELHEEALAIRRRIHDEPHEVLAESLRDLSIVHHLKGELEEAGELARQVLAQRVRLHGEVHRSVAEARTDLGRNHLFRMQLDEAEAEFTRSAEVQEALGGPPDPLLSSTLNHLGQVRHNQGRLDEAETLYSRAHGILSSILGPHHPQTADVRNNVGTVLYARGLHAEAAEVFEEVLDARRISLAPDHPLLAHTLHNLASVYQVLERYPESEDYFRQALALRERTYGPRHRDVGQTRWGLGHLLRRMGAVEPAEAEVVLALEILTEATGPESTSVGAVLLDYGTFLMELGRAAEAEPLLAESLRIRRMHFAEEDRRVGAALEGLNEARTVLGLPLETDGG